MKKVRKRSGKLGLPPGSLVHVGTGVQEKPRSQLFRYDTTQVQEIDAEALDALAEDQDSGLNRWLNIDGLHDDAVMSAATDHCGLHPLLVEDILNTDHRPKLEEFEHGLLVIAKMLRLEEGSGLLLVEQISFVLTKGLLVSYQERPGDVMDAVRERLRQGLGRVRKAGTDYLLYALLDVIVDHYFVVLEETGQRIEDLESKVVTRPGKEDLRAIQRLRGRLIELARHVTPMRELAGRLHSSQSHCIEKPTRRYLSDLQDHTVYIAETIGSFREMLHSLENTYHAGVALRSGEVIKLLTIISTIFIPLTFIVGIYGMNFHHMPELGWRYGYFGVMAFMALLALGMLGWFRWRKWL
ncbi:MAG: magnesium/cobalt transporter CorA [Flavobacteriales bacterium]|nr:magnesium/cobalt transporter CorA [Flavobacteriales bacterium]